MEITLIGATCVAWLGWRYWRRSERLKQEEWDRQYWDRVRRNCPACGARGKEQGGVA